MKLQSSNHLIKHKKNTNNNINDDKRINIVAKEIELCRNLAGNIHKTRQSSLRTLHKWLIARHISSSEFTEHDFERIWKGLFYSVWMSDKPLIQEQLCEDLAKLFTCFHDDIQTCGIFYKSFLKVLRDNWFGIDQHRFDKFLMLVRRVTRGFLFSIKNFNWSKEAVDVLKKCLVSKGTLFGESQSSGSHLGLGLQLHLAELYLEEVAKVSEGELTPETVVELLEPFIMYTCYGDESRIHNHIMEHVFKHLIRQSDLGLEYEEKFQAWKLAGFPGGSIDAMQKIEVDEDADDENDVIEEKQTKTALDPRAGHVDTILPQIPVDGAKIAEHIKNFVTDKRTSLKNRKRLISLAALFEKMSSNNYPYKAKPIALPSDPSLKLPKASKRALQLIKFFEDSKKDEFEGLNKRQRRKMLMKLKKQAEENGSDNEEEKAAVVEAKKKKSNLNTSVNQWVVEDLKSHSDKTDDSSRKTRKSKSVKRKSTPMNSTADFDVEEITNDGNIDNHPPKSDKSITTPDTLEKKLETSTPIGLKKTEPTDDKKSETSTPIRNKKIKSGTSPTNSTNKIKKSDWLDSVFVKNNTKTAQSNGEKLSSVHIGKSSLHKLQSKQITKIKNNQNRLNASDSDLMKKAERVLNAVKSHNKSMSNGSPMNKKVMIQLKNNTSQAVIDYFKSIKASPEIPYDSSKKPLKTSLKPNSIPSPINPFYKKKLNLNI